MTVTCFNVKYINDSFIPKIKTNKKLEVQYII